MCAPDDGWKYHPKHVEQFPDINKLCNFASFWIYEYIGILLGAHPVLHINRKRVKILLLQSFCRANLTHRVMFCAFSSLPEDRRIAEMLGLF